MKNPRLLKLLFVLFFSSGQVLLAQQTTVLLLPTIHRLHEKNPNYTYQDVQLIISGFQPDVIALEIRPEDMEQDSLYLKQFYPPEMIQTRNKFPGINKVGIDFYGQEVHTKLMKLDFFKDPNTELGKFKQMEKQMNGDSTLQELRKQEGIVRLQEEQVRMLSISSANELMDGRYDDNVRQYYSKLSRLWNRTGYSWYESFNTGRDQEISNNIRKLVQQKPGKRIIVLIGANHRNRAVETVKSMKNVKLITRI